MRSQLSPHCLPRREAMFPAGGGVLRLRSPQGPGLREDTVPARGEMHKGFMGKIRVCQDVVRAPLQRGRTVSRRALVLQQELQAPLRSRDTERLRPSAALRALPRARSVVVLSSQLIHGNGKDVWKPAESEQCGQSSRLFCHGAEQCPGVEDLRSATRSHVGHDDHGCMTLAITGREPSGH